MKFYFISGIPGSGKSTVSKKLAEALGIYQVVSTDAIRAIVQRYHNKEEFPELFESSYNVYKHAPEGENNPVVWGFFRQAELMKPGVKGLFKREVAENQDLILEGVHLIPGYYHVPEGVEFHHILITVSDKEKYRKQILGQGIERSKEKINAADYCLEFQDYLIDCAKRFNKFHQETNGRNERDSRPVTIIENNGTIDEMIAKILNSGTMGEN